MLDELQNESFQIARESSVISDVFLWKQLSSENMKFEIFRNELLFLVVDYDVGDIQRFMVIS